MKQPTHRSLALLREMGYRAQVVERWNHFAHVRQDLFGVIDIVAIGYQRIVGIQATTMDNMSKRLEKARASGELKDWIEAGAAFEVWGWGLQGPRGKRKLWTCRMVRVHADGTHHELPRKR